MPLSWPSFTVRDGWWRVKGVAVRAGWYCECIITSLWCGSRTVKETLRSLSNGPWPLDAGKSAFQVKSAPAWGGLLTLSHGGTVYAVTQEEWKHGAMTKPSQPLNTRQQVMICKRAGEQFYNLQHHWNPVCLNLCFHCRPRQSLPDTLIIYYTSPPWNIQKVFLHHFANMSFVNWAVRCLSFCNEHVELALTSPIWPLLWQPEVRVWVRRLMTFKTTDQWAYSWLSERTWTPPRPGSLGVPARHSDLKF